MNRTRWLAAAAAGLAVVIGGGAALAASGSDRPTPDLLGDVAQRLGISQGRLEDAIDDATIARIDAAVAAGDITKAEAEKLKDHVRSGDGPAFLPGLRGPGFGVGPVGPPPEKGVFPSFFPGLDLMDTAADYLGVDAADLREALHDGKSLAVLAKDNGKSVDGLKQALRDEIRKGADRAVDDGKLTREQADGVVEKLDSALDDLVEQARGPGVGIGPAGPPPHKGFFPGVFPGLDLMDRAADYLGVDTADVRQALRDGKSLADLARDEGKSVDGLKDALREAIREDAERSVDGLVEGNLKGVGPEFHLRTRGRP